ncbi:hypothetical protein, partial [Enterobacter cloacae complex sp. 4DZ1-17B1]|uniref:hypothetical protein n=1 Tax=Enterobacter cloacae complex sp. 4DZ1-17B1 TaxID=2511991 RepID=UPI001CA4E4E0
RYLCSTYPNFTSVAHRPTSFENLNNDEVKFKIILIKFKIFTLIPLDYLILKLLYKKVIFPLAKQRMLNNNHLGK